MTEEKFFNLIKDDKYQVFLFASPVPVPLNFAVHTWFVVNLKGDIIRWEFGKFRGSPHPKGIGILKNFFAPTEGMNKFFWKSQPRFSSKLIDFIEGDEDSLAKAMAVFIENELEHYPLKNRYVVTGPNSNTFIQWVLNKFPDAKFRLPFNAIRKGKLKL